MNRNIVLCGVGGQGTVLASKLLAAAAMARGLPVMSAETIGMAQRGGCVFSNIRLGEGVHSPMIEKGTADLILGFEPGEAVRMLPFLKPDGAVVTNACAVVPASASLSGFDYRGETMVEYLQKAVKKLVVVDGQAACAALGSPRVLNMVLLGVAVRTGELGLALEDLLEVLPSQVRPQFVELNRKALTFNL
ncbi:MAG: indolepyruvate oxidoreductase subunit beta [Victivallales bacterium]|nr:indolepyruvate oxidoreductase subunit beta [Victivallales bacterium]